MEDVVKFDTYESGLAVITLNRPDKRNAISKKVVNELETHLTTLENKKDIKLLVITGEGDTAFCAGGDLKEFHGELSADEAYQLLKPMKEVLYRIATLPFLTLAWMNGSARGGGMELATACDFRFATRSGNYGFVQGQLGISTGWGGGTLLSERIHPQTAYYWLVESEVKTVDELIGSGFVQKEIQGNFTPHAEEISMFLSRSLEQLYGWKKQRLSGNSLEILAHTMEEEVKSCSKLWESEAHIEAVNRFFAKK